MANHGPSGSGKFSLGKNNALESKIDQLARKMEKMELKGAQEVKVVSKVEEVRIICEVSGHSTNECPNIPAFKNAFNRIAPKEVNTVSQHYDPYSQTYNLGLSQNLAFCWNQPNEARRSRSTADSESNVAAFSKPMAATFPSSSRTSRICAFLTFSRFESISTTTKAILGGFDASEKRKFPSQPQVSPQGQHAIGSSSVIIPEQAKSIITLWTGKAVDNAIVNSVATPILLPPPEPSKQTTLGESRKQAPEVEESAHTPQVSPIPAPYPQRLRVLVNPVSNTTVYELFKQVKINIPLLDAIKQIPSNAKFLKDLSTKKCKLNVQKNVFLIEQVSSIIQTSTTPKYKDPRCPTIFVMIGGKRVEQALLDLGASSDLLSFSVYQELGLGEMKPTRVTL
ncbi:uncharacterized protein LOC131306802 [Rhododendron vialii]|uniref:uncharacterized protein LOC131306802 n=1 Tax=Rhododendron vialii TaxID=182163 RepID=UPI00265E1500|nr:uncharacterized protein LOC131306802 [Rhododendron vialii]